MATLLRDGLHIVVTAACGNGRFAARVNRSRPGCGMVRLDQRRPPLRQAKSHSASLWSFLNPNRKAMPEYGSKRLGSIRSPRRRRSPVKTNGRAKITYVRTEHPGDPADALTWQSSAE